jgi:multidrug efflux pump subunit AcrB
MNLTDFSLKNPYAIIALILVVAVLGAFAYWKTPEDLFPDTTPPQVVVVTVRPGASASDMADKVTQILEKEFNTLSRVKKVHSISKDEVSSINTEFLYTKPLSEAIIDVQSAISRVKAQLPDDIMEPRLYAVTDATRPLVTIALSPAAGSSKQLTDIRLLAENEIKDQILNLANIADVDIFGSNEPEIHVKINRDKLTSYQLSITHVISILSRQNISAPTGILYTKDHEYLIKVNGEFKSLQAIRKLPLIKNENGIVRLENVAEVALEPQEKRSIYHGNGKSAIGINVLRSPGGPTVKGLKSIKKFLPILKARYPDINFEITNDQHPLININVRGMQISLIQAVLMTVLVIFIFLADMRAAIIVSVSIPLTFLVSVIVLWASPFTFNMISLSGLIISVGLVVDAAVVVIENIYSHHQRHKSESALAAARNGTNEVSLAVSAGIFTTVIVLMPVMFTSGFTKKIQQPLILMISSTLIASLFVAIMVIPLIASTILGSKVRKKNFLERLFAWSDPAVQGLASLYLGILKLALKWRTLVLLFAAALFLLTMQIVPKLIGGELMPSMDTGIIIVSFETKSDASPGKVEKVLKKVEKMVAAQSGVLMISSVVGSEPGQISFSSGGITTQQAKIVVTMVDRTKRSETIWDIQRKWREKMSAMKNIRSFSVMEYGATPLSTTRAPLDIIISGPDLKILDRLTEKCLNVLEGVPGLVDVQRSWYSDKTEYNIILDPAKAREYGTDPQSVAAEMKAVIKGIPATHMRLQNYLDIPIKVKYDSKDISQTKQLLNIYVNTKYGLLPLRIMADIKKSSSPPFISREHLHNTINITAANKGYTIAQVSQMVQKRVDKISVPRDYSIEVAGTAVDMKDGRIEMGKALLVGIILLYILLVAMFKSFIHPLTIMSAIPLAVAGAMWGLLLFDKPMCKPGMMGMVLLSGTIVNNSILILDFILNARANGMDKEEAIFQSVRRRIRPILMTTVSTVVGLSPLVFEMAVGLERMSPLGITASTGLLVGTFLTIVVIPVIYSSVDSLVERIKSIFSAIYSKISVEAKQ